MRSEPPEGHQIPPIEHLVSRAVNADYSTLYLVRFHQGRRRFKKLFVIGNMEIRDDRLSPDGQYYYLVGDRTYLGKIGQPKFRKLSPVGVLYECLFAPNSRSLVGRVLGGEGSLSWFACEQDEQKDLTNHYCSPYFGWYPDSRHIWYLVDSANEQVYYRQDVQTGQRWKLNAQVARRLHTDWALLNPLYRFSHRDIQGKKAYAYAPNERLRVRVEPHDPWAFKRVAGQSQVFLEWKGGGSRLLLKAGSHSWEEVHPQDVSVDGHWVLLVCGRWKQQGEYDVIPEFDLVVIETQTQKLFYPFHGQKDTPVGQPPPLRQRYWFGKE